MGVTTLLGCTALEARTRYVVYAAVVIAVSTIVPGTVRLPGPDDLVVPASQTRVVAALMTEACYGPCPVYEVRVHADGTVYYCGEKYVKTGGVQRARLTPSQLDELYDAFDDAAFDAHERSYWSDAESCGTTTVRIRRGLRTIWVNGSSRVGRDSVPGFVEGPPALELLQQRIAQIVDIQRWTGTSHERNMRPTRTWNTGDCKIEERTGLRGARLPLWPRNLR